MKKSQPFLVLTILALLVAINRLLAATSSNESLLGGLPWYGWAVIGGFLAIAGAAFARRDARRELSLLAQLVEQPPPEKVPGLLPQAVFDKYELGAPNYPHPVVDTERCIGCRACVDVCPQSVLAMVGKFAVPVARDQCAEEMVCQAECPVGAVVVVNTRKPVPPRPAPKRDVESYMTQVSGCYVVGDVAGAPLIKNAANEGADVVVHIKRELDVERELKGTQPEPLAEYDVAIVGAGPAGLSAAVTAKRCGLRYVAIEKDVVLSTIVNYPKKKELLFLPETVEARGPLPINGDIALRELILESWLKVKEDSGVVVNEGEVCKNGGRAEDGDYFILRTEKGIKREPRTYLARRVVLALGRSGAPKKLPAKIADMPVTRDGRTEDKVLDRLCDPESFRRRRVAVVGAGNSAVEAAIALVARRNEDEIEFLPPEEINEVSLIVRSDFKNDLKFPNKVLIYRCIDEGKIKPYFGTVIKEVREAEVVLMNAVTEEEAGSIPNDYVLTLIGGEYPYEIFDSFGIHVPRPPRPAKHGGDAKGA